MSEDDWRIAKVQMESDIRLIRQVLESTDKRVEKIEGNISRVVWLLVAAILGAFATFVIKGGLVIG